MRMRRLLEVILEGSGSAPHVPRPTEELLVVLLLVCCPHTAHPTLPGVSYGISRPTRRPM